MRYRKNIALMRFVACARRLSWLQFSGEAARRATVGGRSSKINFSAGCQIRDGSTSPMMSESQQAHNFILKRHETFRGKFSRRNNQKPNRNCTSKKGRPYIP